MDASGGVHTRDRQMFRAKNSRATDEQDAVVEELLDELVVSDSPVRLDDETLQTLDIVGDGKHVPDFVRRPVAEAAVDLDPYKKKLYVIGESVLYIQYHYNQLGDTRDYWLLYSGARTQQDVAVHGDVGVLREAELFRSKLASELHSSDAVDVAVETMDVVREEVIDGNELVARQTIRGEPPFKVLWTGDSLIMQTRDSRPVLPSVIRSEQPDLDDEIVSDIVTEVKRAMPDTPRWADGFFHGEYAARLDFPITASD